MIWVVFTEVVAGTGEGSDHDSSEDLWIELLVLVYFLNQHMTHHNLGILPGLLLQLILLMLLQPSHSGGKETAGDAGSHCVGCGVGVGFEDQVLKLWVMSILV